MQKTSKHILITAVILFFVYHLILLAAYLGRESVADLKAATETNQKLTIGLPLAAGCTFLIVLGLLAAFPPAANPDALTLRIVGLEFTGPAGPIVLWILAFLAVILAMKWVGFAP